MTLLGILSVTVSYSSSAISVILLTLLRLLFKYLKVSPTVEGEDKEDCLETLHFILLTLVKLLAPFIPFLSEEIFKNLSREESVHLQEWPVADESLIDNSLEEKMAVVRQIVEMGHAKRKEAGVKVRQPLAELRIKNYELREKELLDLIREELNVKKVEVEEGREELTVELDTKITPELKVEGETREIVRLIQEARKKADCGLADFIEVGLPSWPKEFEEEIKKKTLAKKLYRSEEVRVVK